jgi:hypothetical protein
VQNANFYTKILHMSKICRTFAPKLDKCEYYRRMKRMYNKPNTEIMDLKGESLMDGLTVSTNPGGGGGGSAHAPARGDIID